MGIQRILNCAEARFSRICCNYSFENAHLICGPDLNTRSKRAGPLEYYTCYQEPVFQTTGTVSDQESKLLRFWFYAPLFIPFCRPLRHSIAYWWATVVRDWDSQPVSFGSVGDRKTKLRSGLRFTACELCKCRGEKDEVTCSVLRFTACELCKCRGEKDEVTFGIEIHSLWAAEVQGRERRSYGLSRRGKRSTSLTVSLVIFFVLKTFIYRLWLSVKPVTMQSISQWEFRIVSESNVPNSTEFTEPLKPKLVWILFMNSGRTSKRTPHFTITRISWLILFKEVTAGYSENGTKPINTALQIVKTPGIYNYH
jgi:hypothetical protein